MASGKQRDETEPVAEEQELPVAGAAGVRPGEASGGLEAAFDMLRTAEREDDGERQVQLVADALGELSGEQRARLLASPAVQDLIDKAARRGVAAGLKPGSEIKDRHGRLVGKVPWTPESMRAHYEAQGHEMVEWTPHRDQFVSINGIGVFVRAGVPVTTPPAFRDVHEESYQADLSARKTHEKIMAHHFGDFGAVLDLD